MLEKKIHRLINNIYDSFIYKIFNYSFRRGHTNYKLDLFKYFNVL